MDITKIYRHTKGTTIRVQKSDITMEDSKSFHSGPDQILPATGLTTTQPHGAVLFRDMEATKVSSWA